MCLGATGAPLCVISGRTPERPSREAGRSNTTSHHAPHHHIASRIASRIVANHQFNHQSSQIRIASRITPRGRTWPLLRYVAWRARRRTVRASSAQRPLPPLASPPSAAPLGCVPSVCVHHSNTQGARGHPRGSLHHVAPVQPVAERPPWLLPSPPLASFASPAPHSPQKPTTRLLLLTGPSKELRARPPAPPSAPGAPPWPRRKPFTAPAPMRHRLSPRWPTQPHTNRLSMERTPMTNT